MANGFGIQREIEADGAILYLRVTNPRRLNIESLGKVLVKYLTGGYKTVVLDQGRGNRKRLSLLNFLGRLQATANDSKYRKVERRIKTGVSFG